MAEQLNDPSPDFVKFFASQVYAGRMAPSVVEKFTEITKGSLKDFISDLITDRLSKAIDLPNTTAPVPISANTQEKLAQDQRWLEEYEAKLERSCHSAS